MPRWMAVAIAGTLLSGAPARAQVRVEYVAHACFVVESPSGVRALVDPYNGTRAGLLVSCGPRRRPRAGEPSALRPRRVLLRTRRRAGAQPSGHLRRRRSPRHRDRGSPRRALGRGVRRDQHAVADRDGWPARGAPGGQRAALAGGRARARSGRRADAAGRRPGPHPEAGRGRGDPHGAAAGRHAADALSARAAQHAARLARHDRRLARRAAQRRATRLARDGLARAARPSRRSSCCPRRPR